MSENSPEQSSSHRKDFICGVVEGFYGRPWTTEQRKDLFQKLKKWGMDMYVYAPKDDYKHRAYWRELYTVEEAEHLTSLISAAKEQGITFCYALSPGLDITYSNQKEITTLKRKLEQVSQFGCTCFALLFDDIEPEMSEADKQTFQSFAHAQLCCEVVQVQYTIKVFRDLVTLVSITNEIHQHLGCPQFLLCPTQYCSTRAIPSVVSSEYLNTLGTKLSQQIEIMWTGPKVISKILTTECIEEITQVLRRPPVIWDNLHANDYDQKRVFLGPYCGRSPELIPRLRGVLSNPNCEYNANTVPVRTLAHWASCSHNAPHTLEAVSWDIKLERESEQGVCEDDDIPLALGKHVYHHRQALRQAITEWLPEFSIPKTSQGPVVKPQQPTIPPVAMIPIMPSVNTCMSLVTVTSNTTTTSSAQMSSAIPTVNTSQLQALADVCSTPDRPIISTGVSLAETFNPVSNPVMNSLVSPTKVILNESIPNPIIPTIPVPTELPVSTLPGPLLALKNLEKLEPDQNMDKGSESGMVESDLVDESVKKKEDEIVVDDMEPAVDQNGEMSISDTPQTLSPLQATQTATDAPGTPAESDVLMNDDITDNASMQVEPSNSPLSADMMIEAGDSNDTGDDSATNESSSMEGTLRSVDQICPEDLMLLVELFYLPFEHGARGLRLLHDLHWLITHAHTLLNKNQLHEKSEWRRRRSRFAWWVSRCRRLARRLARVQNQELASDLQPYVWDLCAVLALLHGYISWLEQGKFPANIVSNTQGSYTWFSKGWREAFESGAQEPWVFRGGLAGELRRLLPADPAPDPAALRAAPAAVRAATAHDHHQICEICHKTCRDGADCTDLFPPDLQTLPADRLIAPFLTLEPSLCMVIEDDHDIEPLDNDDSDTEKELRVNGTKSEILGYACATLSSKEFYRKQEMAWIPEMCKKYPAELLDRDDLSLAAKECIRHFHQFSSTDRGPASLARSHPALITCSTLHNIRDPHAAGRVLTCMLAALRAHGVCGVHACINSSDQFLLQFYNKLGFVELARDQHNRLYLGRAF